MHGNLFVISVKCILMIDMFLLSVTIFRSIIRDEIIPHAVLWFHGDLAEFHGDSEEDEGEMI